MLAVLLFVYLLAAAAVCITGIVLLRSFVHILQGEPPFVPASHIVGQALANILALGPGSVFYDLGSGDGRVVNAMARAYPHSQCIGIELEWIPYLLSCMRVARIRNARIVRGDFYTMPISGATHVYVYAFPGAVERLFPRILAELKPGSVVVSCDFPYAGAVAEEVIVGSGLRKHTLYVYKL